MHQKDIDNSRFCPPLVPDFFIRRSYKDIEQAKEYGMLYINAPAGYGKTVLVADWLKQRAFDYSWLTLSAKDIHKACLYKNVVLSLSLGLKDNDILKKIAYSQNIEMNPIECAYFALDNITESQIESPFVFVIDDFHLAANETTVRSLKLVRRKLPKNVFMIVISDKLSGNHSNSKKNYFDCPVLGIEPLQFMAAECKRFTTSMKLEISDYEVEIIAKKTRGCAQAVNIIARNYSGYTPKNKVSLHDLVDMALERMDERLRKFYAQLTVVDTIDTAYAEFVTGNDNSENDMESLVDTGLAQKLSNGRYRYSTVFRMSLFATLQELFDLGQLYVRSAQYYEQKKDIVAANQYYRIIKDNKNKELYITAQVAKNTGKLAVLQRKQKHETLGGPETQSLAALSDILWINYCEGNTDQLCQNFEQFERLFGEGIVEGHEIILYRLVNFLNPKTSIYDIAQTLKESGINDQRINKNSFSAFNLSQNMAYFHNSIRDYSEIAHNPEEFFESYRLYLEPLFGSLYNILETLVCAGILFEKKQKRAMELVRFAESLVNEDTPYEIIFCIYALALQGCIFLDMKQQADIWVQKIYLLFKDPCTFYLLPAYYLIKTELALMEGKADAVTDWLEGFAPPSCEKITFYNYSQQIITARCLIVLSKYKDAIELLKRIEVFCTEYQRTIDLISVKTLMAICYWQINDKSKSVDILEAALRLSKKYTYVTVIVREGADVSAILKKIANRISRGMILDIEKSYVKSLLIHAKNVEIRNNGMCLTTLLGMKQKKLSKQQHLMLVYLSKGMSYIDICEETGLKITSVREHITKMYEKFAVHTSTDAIIKAKELGLLEDNTD